MTNRRSQLLEELYQCVLADKKLHARIKRNISRRCPLAEYEQERNSCLREGRRIAKERRRLLRELKETP